MSDTASSTPDPTPTLTVADRLRVLACAECGIAFAAPEALWLQRVQDATPIFCPNGHGHAFREPTPQELLATAAHLSTELANARFRAKRAEARAALAPPEQSGPPTDAELKRRAKLLAHTAKRSNVGGVLCPYCSSHSKNPASLWRHIKRAHTGELAKRLPLWG